MQFFFRPIGHAAIFRPKTATVLQFSLQNSPAPKCKNNAKQKANRHFFQKDKKNLRYGKALIGTKLFKNIGIEKPYHLAALKNPVSSRNPHHKDRIQPGNVA